MLGKLQEKSFSMASKRGQTEAKNKNDQKRLTLKFYHEYHIKGSQKCENCSKIPFGRGCNDLKSSTLLLGWA